MQCAASMQVLADKCPPIFGETLNRPLGYMQVEPRNSHGPIPQGLRSELKPPEALPMSSNILLMLSTAQLRVTIGGGPATQHWATSELHDDIATRSFSRC